MPRLTTSLSALCVAFMLPACSDGNEGQSTTAIGGTSTAADTSAPPTGTESDGATGTGGPMAATGGPAIPEPSASAGANTTDGSAAMNGGAATDGVTASGGVTSTGGMEAMGGEQASGGATASGGMTAAAGMTATGGTTAEGGMTASGGMTAAGGMTATGGAVTDPGFPEFDELKAFPTAEGYGRYALGGRGGRVIEVTNLNDSGPGSLRDAVDQTGPRTVVFTVSGIITLESKLIISGTKANGSLTIAGQTAPGKGILLRGWTTGMIGGSDVVMRFFRTRIGTISGETMDGMGMASGENSIYDHLSISWTIDEAFSSRSAKNITLQRTLISEALNEAGHQNYPAGTQHGYAASIGGDIGSFHHNLLAHCAGRNWSLAGGLEDGTLTYAGRLDIRNNVVYNWRNRTTDGGSHEVNFVNNYYKPGPATELFVALTAENDGFEGTQRYYVSGNVMPGHFDESNQAAARREAGEPRNYNPWVDEPFFDSHVTTQSAEEAYEDVLDDVGCNVPMLDDQDTRIIQETRDGSYTYSGSRTGYPGLIDNESDVGGYEDYPEEQRPADWDTDQDGMPNAWEEAHGLNPEDPADGNATTFSSVGYTNLEMYLNELAGDFE